MKAIKNILTISIPSLIVIFILIEIVSRIFFPGTQIPAVQWDENNRMMKFSKEYGEFGVYTTGNLAQIRAKWNINNEGWNSPVNYYSNKRKGVTRIAIIGDSYIEAFQVDIDKSYPNILANKLGENYEVYAFGMSGAPLSQYLHIARYVEQKFNPDIYIFNVVHNDFNESIYQATSKSFFTISFSKDSLEEIQPAPYERSHSKIPFSSLLKKSSFIRYVNGNLQLNRLLINKPATGKGNVEMNTYIDEVLSDIEIIQKVTDYLLDKIKQELSDKKIIFIMDAPRWSIYKNDLRNSKSLFLNDFFIKLCKDKDLKSIDLTPYMEKSYQNNKTRFESEYDGHWNPYGHAFVAEILHRHLVQP